jgi:hypothetical protein
VFIDDNKNKVKDGTDTNLLGPPKPIVEYYKGNAANICDPPPEGIDVGHNTGVIDTGILLGPDTYTLCYKNLPAGYTPTFPLNLLPPPNFWVTVGPSCNKGTSNSAACTSGNIENANFGITNSWPWIQSMGRDIRIDSGYDQRIPKNNFASLDNSKNSPGIIFSGNLEPLFGQGKASKDENWFVGTPPYPDKYTSSPTHQQFVKTSYAYQLGVTKDNGLEPTDLATKCDLAKCILPPNLSHDLYLANGNVSLNGYTFPSSSNYVILVNGDLRIFGNIRVPVGSTVTFSVWGDIYIDKDIGETDHSKTTTNIDGFYSTDRNFIVESLNFQLDGTNDCTKGPDRRLNIGGTVVVNASLSGGSFKNRRDLCGGNINYPSIYFAERLDLILNAPRIIQHATKTYREVPTK